MNVLPQHYHLYLLPNTESETYSGQISISLHVLKPTTELSLDAKNLDCDSIILTMLEGYMADWERHPSTNRPLIHGIGSCKDELLKIQFGKQIPVGHFVLHISFQSSYTASGVHIQEGVTMIDESSNAIECFPCWKNIPSQFTLTVTVPIEEEAVCSTLLVSQKDMMISSKPMKSLRFETTTKILPDKLVMAAGKDLVSSISESGYQLILRNDSAIALESHLAVEAVTSSSPAYWVSSQGTIPSDAIPLGYESNGEPLFAARAPFRDGIHLGKTSKQLRHAHISWNGSEYYFEDYEILVGSLENLLWLDAKEMDLSHGHLDGYELVQGGTMEGKPLYIGKAPYRGGMQIGHIGPFGMNFGYSGHEVILTEYQVLAHK